MSIRHFWRSKKIISRITGRLFHDRGYQSTTSILIKQSNEYNRENGPLREKLFIYASLGGVLSLFKTDDEKKDEVPELITTIKRSILLIQRGEFKKAEQMLHVALRQAQTLQNEDGITYVYDVLANLAFETGQNAKAKILYTNVMQRLISSGTEPNDKKIIHISLKTAKLLERMRDFETAENGYKYCLKHAEEHVRKTPDDEDAAVLYGMTLDWYANMLQERNRFKEALDTYLHAYQWCLQIYGKKHEQTVVLLSNLGAVSTLLEQYDSAIDYFSDALEIGREVSDTMHLSIIYTNLGKAYMKKALYAEAYEACRTARKLGGECENFQCQQEAEDCLAEIKKLNR